MKPLSQFDVCNNCRFHSYPSKTLAPNSNGNAIALDSDGALVQLFPNFLNLYTVNHYRKNYVQSRLANIYLFYQKLLVL